MSTCHVFAYVDVTLQFMHSYIQISHYRSLLQKSFTKEIILIHTDISAFHIFTYGNYRSLLQKSPTKETILIHTDISAFNIFTYGNYRSLLQKNPIKETILIHTFVKEDVSISHIFTPIDISIPQIHICGRHIAFHMLDVSISWIRKRKHNIPHA